MTDTHKLIERLAERAAYTVYGDFPPRADVLAIAAVFAPLAEAIEALHITTNALLDAEAGHDSYNAWHQLEQDTKDQITVARNNGQKALFKLDALGEER